MTKRSTIGAILGLGLVGSLVLAGCGSGGSADNGGSTTTPAASSSSGTTQTGTGGGSAGGNHKDGNYVMLTLPFNEQVFGVAGQAAPQPAFDQGGYTLDPDDPVWPKSAGEVKQNGVPIWFAGTKGKTGLNFGPEEGGKVTVNADGGKYKTMYVVAGAGNGPGTADVTFNYADGSKDTAQLTVDDWCSSSPTGGTPLWIPQGRLDPSGNATTPACGVFLATVQIPGASKGLKSIDFANDQGNGSQFEPEVLAITLQSA